MMYHNLIERDPALAALIGASASNFGHEASFGSEFGDDYGGDMAGDMAGDFGGNEVNFGDDWGVDFGAVPAAAQAQANAAAARARAAAQHGAMARYQAQMQRTQERARILHPNQHSELEVERYDFTMSENITIGTLQTFTTLSQQPATDIRPQRVINNAPVPFFAFVQAISLGNVNATIGTGQIDCFSFSALAVGAGLDLPTLKPANRLTVLGNYTGLIPPGIVGGTVVPMSFTFRGPASLSP